MAEITAERCVEITKAIDAVLETFNRSNQPGLVAGVALGGRTIYRRACGIANLELGVANQTWTRMRIGSTSKHFAVLAALLLVEEGRLDLDAPVRGLIPELPEEIGEPTLRHFLNHTSGLRDYLDLGFLCDGPAIKPSGTAFRMQTAQRIVNFGIGEKAIYNNGGYHLLSVAIDRVAEMPMEEFVRSRIFQPLGMKDTEWSPSDFEVHRGMATLYTPTLRGGWRKGMFPSEEVRAEGGMISTVDDMLLWLAHMRSAKKIVGKASSWAQMTAPTKLSSGVVVPYGLGLMLGTYRGMKIVHHGGTVFGGACQMLTVPDHQLDIVILTNGALVNPNDLAEKIIDATLSENELGAAQAQAASKDFSAFIGKTYGSEASGVVIKFEEAGGNIAASIYNSPPIPLMNDDGDLRLPFEKVVAGPFIFETAGNKPTDTAPDWLVMTEGGNPVDLARMDTAPSAADMAKELIGRYYAPDLGAHVGITFKDGKLELEIVGDYGRAGYVLTPVSPDLYVWVFSAATFPLRGALRVERQGNAVVALYLETLRTRALKLVREG
jgi:D-aminopeptidase